MFILALNLHSANIFLVDFLVRTSAYVQYVYLACKGKENGWVKCSFFEISVINLEILALE